MGFSRGFGSRGTPHTYQACKKMWDEASSRKLAKGYLVLGANTNLEWCEYDGGHFIATFHGNAIVRYFPEFKRVDACGYESTPTTQGRISRLANVYMSNNSRLGFEQTVRVNGWPYFDGIRIDNFGHVLEEDRKPDTKVVNVKAVVHQYTALFRKIEKVLAARWELGEFDTISNVIPADRYGQLDAIERLFAAGETFVPSPCARNFLAPCYSSAGSLRDRLKEIKEELRSTYYTRHNGYETVEVK